jgi:hypothetical protein
MFASLGFILLQVTYNNGCLQHLMLRVAAAALLHLATLPVVAVRGDMHKWGEIYRNPGSSQLNRQAGEMIYTTVMNLEGVNQFILNKFCTIRNLQHFSNSYSAADAPTAFLEACKQYTRDVAFHGVHIGGAGVIAGYVLSKYGFLVKLPEPFVCPGKGHETLGQLLQQFADHEDMNAVHEHEVRRPLQPC